MANSSQLAKAAEALMAAALSEASAAASSASSDAVAELRHIHGIADKLLASLEAVRAGQEAAKEKLLAGQEAMRQELAGVRAELAAARQVAAWEGRAACLQRAIALLVTTYCDAYNGLHWILSSLDRGLTAIDMEACPGFSNHFNQQAFRTRLVTDLESLTGRSFWLEKKGNSWCLLEQQK